MSKEVAQVEALKTLLVVYSNKAGEIDKWVPGDEKEQEMDAMVDKVNRLMSKLEEVAGLYTLQ